MKPGDGRRNDTPSHPEYAVAHPWMMERFRWLKKWTLNWGRTYHENEITGEKIWEDEERVEVRALLHAEAVSSEDVKTGKHQILIDIDHHCELIPSSTVGHFHLYVRLGMMGGTLSWEDYEEWLRASAKIGLIEPGYVEASARRRATFVRLPWIRKGHEMSDRMEALGEFLDEEVEVKPDVFDLF